jgi:hypothetical protein
LRRLPSDRSLNRPDGPQSSRQGLVTAQQWGIVAGLGGLLA